MVCAPSCLHPETWSRVHSEEFNLRRKILPILWLKVNFLCLLGSRSCKLWCFFLVHTSLVAGLNRLRIRYKILVQASTLLPISLNKMHGRQNMADSAYMTSHVMSYLQWSFWKGAMCMEQGVPSPQTNVSRSGFFPGRGGGFSGT